MPKELKYNLARQAILDQIAGMDLGIGAKLPSERTYAAMLPFSIITIRHALLDLAESGFIERRPASGSFLKCDLRKSPAGGTIALLRVLSAQRPGHTPMPEAASLSQTLQERGMRLKYLESSVFDNHLIYELKNCSGIILTDELDRAWLDALKV